MSNRQRQSRSARRKSRRSKRQGRKRPEEQPGARLSPARRFCFTLLLLLFPVLVFALVEAGLRLGGYGRDYPLFIANEFHPEYRLANPQVIKRYFPDPALAARVSIEIGFFAAEKDPRALRIFVQGGSTAAGFPFGSGASLAGMLQHRLRRDFPERDIEVVSTAMSAVNTYTLLDFADEILEQQPDAILIYAGHNEYLGVLGVGSVFGGGLARPLTQAYLYLKDWRSFQLLQSAIAGARGWFDEAAAPRDDGTLMARLAGSRHIAFESEIFDAGVEQFEGNLDRLLARYREHGIPVFVGTLVSNERDHPPFVGLPAPGPDAEAWQHHFEAGSEALSRGDTAAAAAALQAAVRLDDAAADAHFARGRLLEQVGDMRAARRAYLDAKDRDRLRFRAPEKFNQVIRRSARRHAATVVEVQQAFVEAAPNGVVGNDLMLEHLHPNLDGFFVLANAFYEAMRRERLIDPGPAAAPIAAARRDVPVSEIERLRGLYTVRKLKANWPFQPQPTKPDIPEPRNPVETLAHSLYHKRVPWVGAMQQLYTHYRQSGDEFEALRVALILADALPYLENPQSVAGRMLFEQGRGRQALRYLKRAAELQPDKESNLLVLAQAYLENARTADAGRVLQSLLQLNPNHALAQRLLAQID